MTNNLIYKYMYFNRRLFSQRGTCNYINCPPAEARGAENSTYLGRCLSNSLESHPVS